MREGAVAVNQAARRMSMILESLLQLSDATRAPLMTEPVNLSEVAQNIARELRSSVPDRTVQVELQPDVVVQGDRALRSRQRRRPRPRRRGPNLRSGRLPDGSPSWQGPDCALC